MTRWRPLTWLLLSLACFLGAVLFWRLGNEWKAEKSREAPRSTIIIRTNAAARAARAAGGARQSVFAASTAPMPGPGLAVSNSPATNSTRELRLKYRLSNSTQSVGQLSRSDRAILLANALIDSSGPVNLPIPDALRAQGDPGAYVVQARGPVNDLFRAQLQAAGATWVSYIPNNACLVRADAGAAGRLGALSDVQAVLPFEPYYKLDSSLLALAVEDQPLPPGSVLNVVGYPDRREEALTLLQQSGALVVGEDRSPFGPVFKVQTEAWSLTALAGLAEVQSIALVTPRRPANDLSRARVHVATNSVTPDNYLNLSGTNVIVSVNDSGVDQTHPDFAGRLFGPNLTDTSGHGTHVAGTIAGNGSKSTTVSGASGSTLSGTNGTASDGQFRGMAPAATLLSMPLSGPGSGDFELQEASALTNALISNNSWNYGDIDYDIAAASYDAAVRDSVPGRSNSQPVVYVFSAGNSGGEGAHIGTGGNSDTILSPATAKNVITVGAIEQGRFITNEVHTVVNGVTNITQEWLSRTDSSNQVAGFSSRGNVGVGTEGDFGRFKPDVVAPGTFVISTRSQLWDKGAYYNPIQYLVADFNNLLAFTNSLFLDQIPVSFNTVSLQIGANAVDPVVPLPIYIRHAGYPSLAIYDFIRTNSVSIPPHATLSYQDDSWFFGVGNPLKENVRFDLHIVQGITNNVGDFFLVWSNLNESIGPWYRFETGTSMAAADASGVLALIGDFFTNTPTIQQRPSPALMKAMLINGARSVGLAYDFQVENSINYQGWGLINLANSLPPALKNGLNQDGAPMFVFDQGPTNGLATGQSQTYRFKLTPEAINQPLRVTLVWTDPPGNPVAGVKLVNDLDLIVTNKDSDDVFYGNNILSGNDFNAAWDTNAAPQSDNINNVENVFLNSRFGTNEGIYSVTVFARRVNVNAVTAHTNNVVQDYALVVSCGDGLTTNALKLDTTVPVPPLQVAPPELTLMTNSFPPGTGISGQVLLEQHVGANPPLLGTNQVLLGTNTVWGQPGTNGLITLGVTNQWHFYAITNELGFTNAAFVTFLPPTLALPRMGVTNNNHPDEATRVEADIDMYVARGGDSGLLTLNIASVNNATRSLGRGGTEVLTFGDAEPGEVFYIGIKSEDYEAAEYGFLALFSELPFSTSDTNGVALRGVPVPADIPDAAFTVAGKIKPGVALVFGIAAQPVTVRRVLVTNTLSQELIGDLVGTLTHNQISVVLNNHSCPSDPATGLCFTNYTFVYEDNGENDIVGSLHTDGPGSLRDFVGEEGVGLWMLAEVDNLLQHTGRVENLWIRLERQAPAGSGTLLNIAPNSFGYLAVDVPPEATNMTICVVNESDTPLPLELFVRFGDFPTLTEFDHRKDILPPGDCLSIDTLDLPPLRPGRHYIGVYNPNSISQKARVFITLDLSAAGVPTLDFTAPGSTPIIDDAVTYSSIFVTNKAKIVRVEVGVSIEHPRVSDLGLTLISPKGERILLYENRGGPDTVNLGGGGLVTNYFGTQVAGDFNANTNVLNPVPVAGTLYVDYEFFPIPDTLDVFYEGTNIFSSGVVSNAGTFGPIPYGPGTDTTLTIIANLNGNADTNTLWNYTPRVVSLNAAYLVFTENTNTAKLPMKFALLNPDRGSNYVLSDFEVPVAAGDYLARTNVGGWLVDTNRIGSGTNEFGAALTNRVSVLDDPATALPPGGQFLTLASGIISTNISLNPGDRYVLNYSYRGPGMINFWRGEFNANDSVGTNNGVLVGGATFGVGMVGPTSAAFDLNGNTAYVEVPDSDLWHFGTNGFSMDVWVNFRSWSPSGVYFIPDAVFLANDENQGVFNKWMFAMFNGDLTFHFNSPATGPIWLIQSPFLPELNRWYHLAVVRKGDLFTIYRDGVAVGSQVFSVDLQNPDASLTIGQAENLGYMDGLLDEISIYQRALSASEIKAIYDAGSAGKFDRFVSEPAANTLSFLLAKAQLSLAGIRTNIFYGDNTNWQSRTISFTPTTNTVSLQVTGLAPGMLLDQFTVARLPNETFVLPESSLKDLVGESAFGMWTLEVWDSRTGLPLPAELVSWQLRFILESAAPPITPLFDRIPVTNSAPECQTAYFYVDVPFWVKYVTNRLLFADAPVTVWFNQDTPPTGTNANDVALIPNATNGFYIISTDTNFPPPPLIPGSRYYLSVEIPCTTNGTDVNFAVEVDFGVGFIRLTNMIPYGATNSGATNSSEIFVYGVTTNAARAQFEIDFPSDRMTLVARYGTPPTGLFNFDYGSTNAGFNGELIVVFTNSIPVALQPGDWYLEAINISGAPVSYVIMASEWPETGRPFSITNSIATTNNFCIYWTALPFVHYFVQGVPEFLSPATTNWYTLTHTMTAFTNEASFCLTLPSPYHFLRVAEGLALEDVPYPPPLLSASLATNGVRLDWLGSVTARYEVQWAPDLLPAPIVWNTFTNPATSGNGVFSILDDGTETGGFGTNRFYRVRQIIVP